MQLYYIEMTVALQREVLTCLRLMQDICAYQKPLLLFDRILSTLCFRPHDNEDDRPWIMEVGCGTGSASHAALELGFNVMAFDDNPVMVDATRRRLFNRASFPDKTQELIPAISKKRGRKRQTPSK